MLNMEIGVGAQEVETGRYRAFVVEIRMHSKDYSLLDVVYYIYTAVYLTDKEHARLV